MQFTFSTVLGLLGRMVVDLLRFEWVASAGNVLRDFRPIVMRLKKRCDVPRRAGKVADTRCVPMNRPEMKRPDPLIYSQHYLMQRGLAVTWDNPDIWLERHGSRVSSAEIEPGTEYEIVARIWNGSTEAPVPLLPVRFSFLSFGVGTVSTDIPGAVTVNLGVKGGPDTPAIARKPWRTPRQPGHYCIQVLLDWKDDTNPDNNLGQENLVVGVARSPAEFSFALRNGSTERRTFRFETDGYAIPEQPSCDAQPGMLAPAARNRLLPHARGSHPLPEGWHVEIEPRRPTLTSGEEITVCVTVTPPEGFRGMQPVNVNAFDNVGFRGGVTCYVGGG